MACMKLMEDDDLARFRTKMCQRHATGGCDFNQRCQYSHNTLTQRRCPFLLYNKKPLSILRYIPIMCEHIKSISNETLFWDDFQSNSSGCSRGVGCPFAHSMEEIFFHPLIYKQKLCEKYHQQTLEDNNCKCSEYYCSFVHDPKEKRNIYSDTYKLAPSITKRLNYRAFPLDQLTTITLNSKGSTAANSTDTPYNYNEELLQADCENMYLLGAYNLHDKKESQNISNFFENKKTSCKGFHCIVASPFKTSNPSIFSDKQLKPIQWSFQINPTTEIISRTLSVSPGDILNILVDSFDCKHRNADLQSKFLKSDFNLSKLNAEETSFNSDHVIKNDESNECDEYNSKECPRLFFVKCTYGSAVNKYGWIPASVVFGLNQMELISDISFDWSSKFFAELLDQASALDIISIENSQLSSGKSYVLSQIKKKLSLPETVTPILSTPPSSFYFSNDSVLKKSIKTPEFSFQKRLSAPKLQDTTSLLSFNGSDKIDQLNPSTWRQNTNVTPLPCMFTRPQNDLLRKFSDENLSEDITYSTGLPNLLESLCHRIPPPASNVYERDLLLKYRPCCERNKNIKTTVKDVLPARFSTECGPYKTHMPNDSCQDLESVSGNNNDNMLARQKLLQQLLTAETELQRCIAAARECELKYNQTNTQKNLGNVVPSKSNISLSSKYESAISLGPNAGLTQNLTNSHDCVYDLQSRNNDNLIIEKEELLTNHVIEKLIHTLQHVQQASHLEQHASCYSMSAPAHIYPHCTPMCCVNNRFGGTPKGCPAGWSTPGHHNINNNTIAWNNTPCSYWEAYANSTCAMHSPMYGGNNSPLAKTLLQQDMLDMRTTPIVHRNVPYCTEAKSCTMDFVVKHNRISTASTACSGDRNQLFSDNKLQETTKLYDAERII